jgi:hypothetical protein
MTRGSRNYAREEQSRDPIESSSLSFYPARKTLSFKEVKKMPKTRKKKIDGLEQHKQKMREKKQQRKERKNVELPKRLKKKR